MNGVQGGWTWLDLGDFWLACLGFFFDFFGMVDHKVSFATAGFMCRLG